MNIKNQLKNSTCELRDLRVEIELNRTERRKDIEGVKQHVDDAFDQAKIEKRKKTRTASNRMLY